MTATDPRVHVACRALAEAMGAPLEWRYFESEARLVIAAADGVDPIREALQAAEAALAEQRDTNARLNRRAQIAEAAVNGFTNNGMRQGLRSDRILAEYWQRAEDARAELAALKAVTT